MSLQGVPATARMPLALSLGSYSAFQMGPHFLCTALPFSASRHGPPRTVCLPLLSSTAAATEAPLGPGGRGAEKAAPRPAGAGDLGSRLRLPAWLPRAQRPPGPAFQAVTKPGMSKDWPSAPAPSPRELQRGSGREEGEGGCGVSSQFGKSA